MSISSVNNQNGVITNFDDNDTTTPSMGDKIVNRVFSAVRALPQLLGEHYILETYLGYIAPPWLVELEERIQTATGFSECSLLTQRVIIMATVLARKILFDC